ncbi:hypothetical protein C8A05DRAFT_40877 [Staphylotrichum tortipilum]|uniref:RING-type domain-containing protein n=1 Tax=Staphylotrichum tortipilum TaxID=2831512 RepID=A0AAN6RXC3_9PEZI|nr:hypothetical protein C8A05DRAFT_40877 [Staphylotrichum longicolle]
MPTNPPDNSGCYAPDPKYTFLYAPTLPHHSPVHCVICKDAQLTLPSTSTSIPTCKPPTTPEQPADGDDTTPSLLPCGHVFGTTCLSLWLASHATCPACRFPLRYELCPHPVPPLRLTRAGVLFAPPTVPAGGAVAAQCAACRRETDRRVVAQVCVPLVVRYYQLMGEGGGRGQGRRGERVRREWEVVLGMVGNGEGEDQEW